MSKKPVLAVYRFKLLPPSETFVKAQSEALQSFTPYYTGLRLIKGLPLPSERTLVVNRGGLLGRMNETSFKLWGFATPFVQQLRNLNPALIHAHFASDGAMALPLAQKLQIPLIVTCHGFDILTRDDQAEPSLGRRIYLRRRERLKQQARLFIAVSEFTKKKLLEQNFPPDKIVVHYIGVDTQLFQGDPSVQREPIVLFTGRLAESKGCEYLIRAMGKVQTAMPEVELVVIGDGILRSSLEELAKKTLRRYRFLGVQPRENVKAWMQRAKVFCVPSITAKSGDAETFGMVFAEAQAMGLPVVSSTSGGIPEAVAHGETGFLVAEGDSDGLAAYILRLLEDKELWQRFSQSGQERVRKSFDLHNQTRLLERIYVDRILHANL